MSLLDKIKQEHQSPTVKVNPRKDDLILTLDTVEMTETGQKKQAQEMIVSLEKELQTLPVITTKKMGVRLDQDIYDEIRSFCQKNQVTLETLLEAFFMTCQNHPVLLNQVIENAQSRVKQRTKAGNIRSLLTKVRNIQGNS